LGKWTPHYCRCNTEDILQNFNMYHFEGKKNKPEFAHILCMSKKLSHAGGIYLTKYN
jgi:hypothetical protein